MSDAAAGAEPRQGTAAGAEVLVDVLFATTKELRHQAEQLLGRLFVPLEVREAGEHRASLILRPAGLGEIQVHAEREKHWHPYRVTRVEPLRR